MLQSILFAIILSMTSLTSQVPPMSMDSEHLTALTSHTIPEGGSDGSGMSPTNRADLPIPLPSTLGWEWCVSHGVQSLAIKEAQLRLAQANESIHKICLSLLDSGLPSTASRSDWPSLRRRRPVLGVPFTVWRQLWLSMHGFTAWRMMHTVAVRLRATISQA